MASMTEITCKCGCGRKKMVRTADVKRGWGRFFDKSCKAREQERRTGQYARFKNGGAPSAPGCHSGDAIDEHIFSSEALGQWED